MVAQPSGMEQKAGTDSEVGFERKKKKYIHLQSHPKYMYGLMLLIGNKFIP